MHANNVHIILIISKTYIIFRVWGGTGGGIRTRWGGGGRWGMLDQTQQKQNLLDFKPLKTDLPPHG